MNESAQVINIQDQLIVKEFGIEEITAANIALMEKQILEIPEKPETKEQYDDARRFNIDAKKLIPRIEERRKELKAPVLEKCKAIDDTAKKAVSMVQPLIDLSGTRREAWEAEKAAEKAEKERIEAERVVSIQAKLDMLNHIAGKPIEYNRASSDIEQDIANLEAFEINAIDFQERMGDAELIKSNAIKSAKTALENRKKFEADQAEVARVKAEHEAEKKRLAEERAKLEVERKAQEEAARAAAEAEAEKLRQEQEAIRAERGRLEAEKAKVAHAAVVAEREAVLDEAHNENLEFDHAKAIEENDRLNAESQVAQADFEAAHAAALVEHEEYRKRQQLIAIDKMMKKVVVDSFHEFIEKLAIPEFNMPESMSDHCDLIARVKSYLEYYEAGL